MISICLESKYFHILAALPVSDVCLSQTAQAGHLCFLGLRLFLLRQEIFLTTIQRTELKLHNFILVALGHAVVVLKPSHVFLCEHVLCTESTVALYRGAVRDCSAPSDGRCRFIFTTGATSWELWFHIPTP